MNGQVFDRTMRDQRRGLVGWGIAFMALVAVEVALWPTVRSMPDLERFLEGYPEALKELFNISEFRTGAGFLNAELFSIMLPALFIVFAVGRGARLIAGEERLGALEMVLTSPVSRREILLEKAAALAASTMVLGLVLFASTLAGSVVTGMDIALADIALASIAMVLIGVEHGWLALAVGAATGRRGLAIGVAGTVATIGYVLYVASALVDALHPWRVLSPFHQALDGGPIGAGWRGAYVWMVAGAIAAIAVAAPLFHRRDVRA